MNLRLKQTLPSGKVASVNFHLIDGNDETTYDIATDGLGDNERTRYLNGDMWYFKPTASISSDEGTVDIEIPIMQCKNSGMDISSLKDSTINQDLSRLLSKSHAQRKIAHALGELGVEVTKEVFAFSLTDPVILD